VQLPVRRIDLQKEMAERPNLFHDLEWLVTNGIGGYASGTVSGVFTRRYHGFLISAMPAPLGRTFMFAGVTERCRLPDGRLLKLFDEEPLFNHDTYEPGFLKEFRLEGGLPVWTYQAEEFLLEKRVIMPYMQNTVHIIYSLLEGDGSFRIKLRPSMHFRRHEAPVDTPLQRPYTLQTVEGQYEFFAADSLPSLRMFFSAEQSAFTVEEREMREILYVVEETRGYERSGNLWSPGYFRATLKKGRRAALTASTEDWEMISCMTAEEALEAELERRRKLLFMSNSRSPLQSEMVLAADQFIITPVGRPADAAVARASGDEVRTVIAGYHWFTDWGRDTMISLEGLALSTGRRREAGYILRTFANYVNHGLIPNMFPEGNRKARYNTADASLWFFHAISRYLSYTEDVLTLQRIFPRLVDIVDQHVKGTLFGIGVDPDDGLLFQGEEGYALTWMDAKVDDWVVTPRRGKAVEINALWYNALRLMEKWSVRWGETPSAERYGQMAQRARESFNRKFWYQEGAYLYDIVECEDGCDDACRPNQIFAVSLEHPVAEKKMWEPVVQKVKDTLLTPFGLRSLAAGHPSYKTRYQGDLRTRDAAYHQGTIWSWLIGPFIDAWLKVHPDAVSEAREFLDGLIGHLNEACIGQVSEVFNAEEPFVPAGCIAQAWGMAELLRSLIKTDVDEAQER
jgi:predicted glycogen debranching enzyme